MCVYVRSHRLSDLLCSHISVWFVFSFSASPSALLCLFLSLHLFFSTSVYVTVSLLFCWSLYLCFSVFLPFDSSVSVSRFSSSLAPQLQVLLVFVPFFLSCSLALFESCSVALITFLLSCSSALFLLGAPAFFLSCSLLSLSFILIICGSCPSLSFAPDLFPFLSFWSLVP